MEGRKEGKGREGWMEGRKVKEGWMDGWMDGWMVG